MVSVDSSAANLRCPLCSHEFQPAGAACHVHCPLGSHCHLICCPRCGYQMVDAGQSTALRWWRRLFSWRRDTESVQATQLPADLTLDLVPIGAPAHVRGFAGMTPNQLARCAVLGITIGAEIALLQRRPAPVLRVGESEIALGRELAACIQVQLMRRR